MLQTAIKFKLIWNDAGFFLGWPERERGREEWKLVRHSLNLQTWRAVRAHFKAHQAPELIRTPEPHQTTTNNKSLFFNCYLCVPIEANSLVPNFSRRLIEKKKKKFEKRSFQNRFCSHTLSAGIAVPTVSSERYPANAIQ